MRCALQLTLGPCSHAQPVPVWQWTARSWHACDALTGHAWHRCDSDAQGTCRSWTTLEASPGCADRGASQAALQLGPGARRQLGALGGASVQVGGAAVQLPQGGRGGRPGEACANTPRTSHVMAAVRDGPSKGMILRASGLWTQRRAHHNLRRQRNVISWHPGRCESGLLKEMCMLGDA